MELTALVYRITQQFPREEAFGLSAQLRRAAISIPSNIAEGQGRLNRKEFRQFLSVARGSNCELQTQLEIARALGFGDSNFSKTLKYFRSESAKCFQGCLRF